MFWGGFGWFLDLDSNSAWKTASGDRFRSIFHRFWKFGLLLIELHTSKPELVKENIGKTAATAYDATHGYSDQYIVEIEEYMKAMKEIGLTSDGATFRKFPNSDLATVSINLFESK